TLTDVVCRFKSLCVRNCKQKYGIDNLFQRSFFDHIIRDNYDYETRRKYILENPIKWYYKNK
ncbi:MAG: transposase, partial [Clostridia bacterium]|nr:transposase [Clostridia bacterium]